MDESHDRANVFYQEVNGKGAKVLQIAVRDTMKKMPNCKLKSIESFNALSLSMFGYKIARFVSCEA